jgi:cell division protein FtsW
MALAVDAPARGRTRTHAGPDPRVKAHERARRKRAPKRPAAPAPSGPPPTAYYVLGGLVGLLTMFGLVMVMSASSVRLFHLGASPWFYFSRQLMWSTFGVIALVTTMRVPYDRWRTWVKPALAISYAMMLLPFIPGLGVERGGAKAWVQLGPFGFQPSEFLKLAVLLYCADLLTRFHDHMHLVRVTLWPCLTVLGVSCGFMLAQGDLGSAIVLSSIVLSVVFIGGAPLVPLAGVGAGMGVIGLGFVLSTSYRRDRWTAFLNLAKTRDKEGYQVWQSLVSIADGGVTGVGIGAGASKWGYVPLAHSDFIFAVIAEELGLVGVVAVIGCYLLFGFFGVQVALASPDRFGMLLAGGITAWISVQAAINIGGVTGAMPLTGLTLPFISFGGSSLLATMTAAGLLLNVARSGR